MRSEKGWKRVAVKPETHRLLKRYAKEATRRSPEGVLVSMAGMVELLLNRFGDEFLEQLEDRTRNESPAGPKPRIARIWR